MATSAKLTVAEFLALPETKPGCELIDGEVVQKALPNILHMMAQQVSSLVVGQYVQRNALGVCGPEGRCVFGPPGGERAFLPDFLFLAGAHLGGIDPFGPIRRAPDFAVEILSPDDRMGRVLDKLRFYLTYGVRLVWLIDPETRAVTVMSSPEEARILGEDETLEGGEVLPGFSCRVRDILPPVEFQTEES